MNARSHEQTSPTWYTLRRDKTFWVASTLFTIALVPYVLPGLPADRLIVWVDDYADVFVQGAVLVALLGGITRVRSERERRFWAWAGFAVAALFLGECVSAFVPLSMRMRFSIKQPGLRFRSSFWALKRFLMPVWRLWL